MLWGNSDGGRVIRRGCQGICKSDSRYGWPLSGARLVGAGLAPNAISAASSDSWADNGGSGVSELTWARIFGNPIFGRGLLQPSVRFFFSAGDRAGALSDPLWSACLLHHKL